MQRTYFRLFVVLRAPEHTETIYLWKVEEHNFHIVLIRRKKIKISRRTVSLGPHSVRNILGPKKSTIFDLKIFHFHTIFNEKFPIFSISKNFENIFFGFFLKIFEIENFH